MYHPVGNAGSIVPNGTLALNPPSTWLELYNRSDQPLDLSDWRLTGDVNYQFPPATDFPAGSYLVVARDLASMRANHPNVRTLGPFTGELGRARGTSSCSTRSVISRTN